jgi:hypothetical protein
MALISADLPEGFGRLYNGSYIPGNLVGPETAREALAAAGLQRTYEDNYGKIDSPISIGLFIDEYSTPEGAAAGFAAFDDETLAPPDESVTSSSKLPGPGVGEEPSETIVETHRYPDGTTSQYVEARFRIGNLNAGIWEERYAFPDESGTPQAVPATPEAPGPEQMQHVADMSAKLAARMEMVLAGETPPGIDPALAAQVLPIDTASNVSMGQSWEGYRDGPVIFGYDGSLMSLASSVKNGYGRTVSIGVGPDFPPPYIAVTLADLESPEAAQAALDAVRTAPGDLPTPGPFPRGAARDLVADPSIPGADAALAFGSALDEENPDAPVDSARVVFTAGPKFVAVDVQGADSAEAALAAAEDLAAQQAACLSAGGPCTAVSMPEVQVSASATPAA